MNDPSATLCLLAAALHSSAAAVVSALSVVTPDEVRLLDAPTATCLDAALEMAKNRRAPVAVLLNDELLRSGAYSGHHGELAKNRLIDAVTTDAAPERLWEFAGVILAQLVRARMLSAADAIAERARDGAEADAWQTFVREGAAVRSLWERLCSARGEVAA